MTSDFNDKIANFFGRYWYLIILVFIFSLSYLTYIELYTADLGRHIVNGREIVTGNSKLLSTNYFSFTQTEFPFINHHWFFGVIVFYFHKFFGFTGLTLLNLILNTLAFIFVIHRSLKQTKQPLFVFISGLLIIPMFVHRNEVRPESFSLFFFSLFLLIFDYYQSSKFQNQKNLQKILQIAPIVLIQILWTNIHLFFILGPLLSGYYLLESIIQKSSKKQLFFWTIFTILLFFVTLINPHGISGAAAPLNIFNNYVYRVAENQSTIFMFNYGINRVYFLYVIIICLITIFSHMKYVKEKFGSFFLLSIFILLGNKINRMTPFLGLILIPSLCFILSKYLNKYIDKFLTNNSDENIKTLIISSLSVIAVFTILLSGIFLPNIRQIGTGLEPKANLAAEFFTKNNLKGPIFNNYDIGGYLVFNLFPSEKMFIDNRPEAYSNEFITNEYLESLKNPEKWKNIEEKYKLNVIFFYRHDQIDGAQEFLYNRVVDENWVPVYVDHIIIIFVKNNQQNSEIIKSFALPEKIFNFSSK